MSTSGENDITADGEVRLETPEKRIYVFNIIGRSFSILFKNFLPFTLLALLFTTPPLLFDRYVLTPLNIFTEFTLLGFVSGLAHSLGILFFYILIGTLVYGTFMTLKGETARIGDALGQGFRRFLPVVGVAIVYFLITAVAFYFLLIPGTLGVSGAFVGILIAIVAIILVIVFAVAIPVTVVEKKGVWKSMQRSRDLTKGSRWRVFGVLFVGYFVWSLPTMVVVTYVALTAQVSIEETITSHLIFIESTYYVIFGYVIDVIGGAFYAVVIAVTYHQLRTAKEGLDSEQLAAVFD